TSAYGVDLRFRTGFVDGRPVRTRMIDLVRELARLDVRVRLHYVYPYPHVDEVLPLMAEGRVLPYLDVPFQHSHPRVLRAMKRPASGETNLERIHTWRALCPDLTIRSTFIVGFPGETEAEFEHLLAFVEEAQLDRVGCFAYSPVDGAAANALADPVPDEVREARRRRLMQVQARVSAERLRRRIGSETDVLVDAIEHDRASGRWRAATRSAGEAPEVDGVVYVSLSGEDEARACAPGSELRVRIVDAAEHDLYAVPVHAAR